MACKQVVRRLYVHKKAGCDIEAQGLLHDLQLSLGIRGLTALTIYNRYDVSGLSDSQFHKARTVVFAEPPVDETDHADCDFGRPDFLVAVEALPGQYDQRADSAAQCLQIITGGERPLCRTARVYAFGGTLTETEKDKIRSWLINPVEAREASLDLPDSLAETTDQPQDIETVARFAAMDEAEIDQLLQAGGFAMTLTDLLFVQHYFRSEQRDPTWTELRVLDTYWSDHCRHTTFLTHIRSVTFPGEAALGRILQQDWADYQALRASIHGDRLPEKPACLMDLATLAMKALRRSGDLDDLDASPEINACSIRVTIPVDGKPTNYLVMFKNETHNHPTEIEPFGGAATCIGGAIRDPLSGRSYVYQAMRVTGSGDPTGPVSDTLPGKLPQRKITTTAAAGYSSYGNQVGLATGLVDECYHPGYVAKRMEIGAVIGAVPADQVRREVPEPGDQVILLGGRTGRDGCGGATGSSRAHDEQSIVRCGSEVQKGNAPTERKIQRLFRDPDVAHLIRRCNDFGAGGVSVAIGELADGLLIDLDRVPKKYEGLDGTELAISESQERMAVVVAAGDTARFIAAAERENLEAVVVATVTQQARMIMTWRGQVIVDLARSFINTNGAPQQADVRIQVPADGENWFEKTARAQAGNNGFAAALKTGLASLSGCSRRGLAERFDSTIGAGTVLLPFGGERQLTPEEGMAALIPTPGTQTTDACSLMTYGFDPDLSAHSPYHGATYAVIESLARIAALGGDAARARLTFQEYFRRLQSPDDWGQPLAALLGAFRTQLACRTAAIGGKDSMSGTFRDLHVPPTLVSFAVAVSRADQVLSAAIDRPDRAVYLLPVPADPARPGLQLPDCQAFMANLARIHELNLSGALVAAATVRHNGVAVACARMCFGNGLGFAFAPQSLTGLFSPQPGALLLAAADETAAAALTAIGASLVGHSTQQAVFTLAGEQLPADEALKSWEQTLEPVFPTRTGADAAAETSAAAADAIGLADDSVLHVPAASPAGKKQSDRPPSAQKAAAIWRQAKPVVFIPVFPGTNCEYDSARAFSQAGAKPDLLVVRNNSPQALRETIAEMSRRIQKAQIIMLPGGFSAGDEPEGSGKFIAAVFRNPQLTEAVEDLLERRDGLILGICNGFQALIKLGLLPYGRICDLDENSPTLTFNQIGRHMSRTVTTRVASVRSPWLAYSHPGDLHRVAVSHGEGRFIAPPELIRSLAARGQIATQYVRPDGRPDDSTEHNPNGSMAAIEGITSENGHIFGKMGHSERSGPHLMCNIPGEKHQPIFAAGVAWFMG